MTPHPHTTETLYFLPAALLALLFWAFLPSAALAQEKISIKANGLTLNANLQLAGDKKLSDGVVLITHGTLAHNKMEIISTLQELLKERGHNSLAINLSLGIDNRNSAPYDCKTPHKHQHWDATREIGAWVKWLTSRGASNITLLGHSRGGAQTAAYAAITANQAIKYVVLIAPAIWSIEHDQKSYQKTNKTALAPVLARAKQLVNKSQGDRFMENTGLLYCPNSKVTARSFLSYYQPDKRRHTPYLLQHIKLPTLILAGSDDKVVKGLPELVRPLIKGKKIKGKNMQLKVIADTDHYFRDFAAEEVADTIDEFLKP
ncbi:MAG: alpha/beta hydrolase [Hyphomicrobiaceae bacterium]|nr:alpha/beta hydrolase [Hyphomicrobiaceae bacterium]